MWLAIFLCVIILVLLVGIGFLTKALLIQIKKEEVYTTWIVETQNRVEETYEIMKTLDRQQMFSKDDDVGDAFKKIVEVIEYLNSIVARK